MLLQVVFIHVFKHQWDNCSPHTHTHTLPHYHQRGTQPWPPLTSIQTPANIHSLALLRDHYHIHWLVLLSFPASSGWKWTLTHWSRPKPALNPTILKFFGLQSINLNHKSDAWSEMQRMAAKLNTVCVNSGMGWAGLLDQTSIMNVV